LSTAQWVGFYSSSALSNYPFSVHPVLFHIGPILVPAYGAVTALGILLALWLALRTARVTAVNPNHLWNLCIIALFVAIAGSRLLLVILNWTIVRAHPSWLLSLAMIHHPLLAAAGALLALIAAVFYARSQKLPFADVADALAAPLALALACEQIGALLAGSGYGVQTSASWAIIYTHPLALRWSGTPLFVPLHPVQAYAASAFLLITLALIFVLPRRRQHGDTAGLWLIFTGAALYYTEFWRDPEGRGSFLHGALDGPQLAAVAFVLIGALLLLERPGACICPPAVPCPESVPPGAPPAREVPHV
jgi:phosphatidylglycerol---prolipoprotein diacylglyceryl transferase